MKRSLLWVLFLLFGSCVFADAGFSIRRKHELVIFSFSGINNLGGYKLIQTHVGFYAPEEDKRPYVHLGQIIPDDNYTITVQEGGRRWEESDRYIYLELVDTLTGKSVETLHLYAKDYSMHFKITGVKDGKLEYSTDSTRAVYQYLVLGEDEESAAAYRRNRLIFIACSSLGFILLAWLFIRRKKIVGVQAEKKS